MKIFDIFKRKVADTQKNFTLEDCVVKMFESAGIVPGRQGNMFHTEVQGKYCAYNVGLNCDAGNKLIVCVPFFLPVGKDVAFAANYEVERISKEISGKFPGTIVYLAENDKGYKLTAITIKTFGELSDCTPSEIHQAMIHAVDAIDDKNFASLTAAIVGYESYEELQGNMKAASADGKNVAIQLKDGYRELLGKVPDLENSRYLGRLMAYATHIMMAKDNDELVNRAAGNLKESFDGFIQEIYNVADEKERDLIRKLRFLGTVKTKNNSGAEDDFVLGRNEAKSYLDTSGNPWRLVYGENLDNPDVPGADK